MNGAPPLVFFCKQTKFTALKFRPLKMYSETTCLSPRSIILDFDRSLTQPDEYQLKIIYFKSKFIAKTWRGGRFEIKSYSMAFFWFELKTLLDEVYRLPVDFKLNMLCLNELFKITRMYLDIIFKNGNAELFCPLRCQTMSITYFRLCFLTVSNINTAKKMQMSTVLWITLWKYFVVIIARGYLLI